MAITFRTFRSQPGRDGDLIESLRSAAARALRSEPGSVVVCRTDDPREVVWIANRQGDPALPPAPAPSGSEPEDPSEDLVAGASPALSLSFLDGWYRLPAPPYQIWSVEVYAAGGTSLATLKDLFELSRWQAGAHHIVGRSVFRAIEDESLFIGFVGFTWRGLRDHEVSRPDMSLRIARRVIWRPLSVVHKIESIGGGGTRTSGGEAVSALPFWTASGTSPFWRAVSCEESPSAPPGQRPVDMQPSMEATR